MPETHNTIKVRNNSSRGHCRFLWRAPPVAPNGGGQQGTLSARCHATKGSVARSVVWGIGSPPRAQVSPPQRTPRVNAAASLATRCAMMHGGKPESQCASSQKHRCRCSSVTPATPSKYITPHTVTHSERTPRWSRCVCVLACCTYAGRHACMHACTRQMHSH